MIKLPPICREVFAKWPQGEWHPNSLNRVDITADYMPNRRGCYSRFSLIYIGFDLLEWGPSVLPSTTDIAFWYDHGEKMVMFKAWTPLANRSCYQNELKTHVTWSVYLFYCRNENSPPDDDLHLTAPSG